MNEDMAEQIKMKLVEYKKYLDMMISNLNDRIEKIETQLVQTPKLIKKNSEESAKMTNAWAIIAESEDQLHKIKTVIEETNEHIREVYNNLIKSKNIYDNTDHDKLEDKSHFKEVRSEREIKTTQNIKERDEFDKIWEKIVANNTLLEKQSNKLSALTHHNPYKPLKESYQYLELTKKAGEKITEMWNDLETTVQALNTIRSIDIGQLKDSAKKMHKQIKDETEQRIETTLQKIRELQREKTQKNNIKLQDRLEQNESLKKIQANIDSNLKLKGETPNCDPKYINIICDNVSLNEKKEQIEEKIKAEMREEIEKDRMKEDYLQMDREKQNEINEVLKDIWTVCNALHELYCDDRLSNAEENIKQIQKNDENYQKANSDAYDFLRQSREAMGVVHRTMMDMLSIMKVAWETMRYFLAKKQSNTFEDITLAIEKLSSIKVVQMINDNYNTSFRELKEKSEIGDVFPFESFDDLIAKPDVLQNEPIVPLHNQIQMVTKEFLPKLGDVKAEMNVVEMEKYDIEAPSHSTAIKDTRSNLGEQKAKKK